MNLRLKTDRTERTSLPLLLRYSVRCRTILLVHPSPKAITARTSVSSSPSQRIASFKWRGVIRFTLWLRAISFGILVTTQDRIDFWLTPASSSTSTTRYSRTAVVYMAAVGAIRTFLGLLRLRKRFTRPQGNCMSNKFSSDFISCDNEYLKACPFWYTHSWLFAGLNVYWGA